MGRLIKKKIDYSNWSVDIFDNDAKIDKLIDAQGWCGFGVYFYLCQRAYGSEGYFYPWSYDDAATTARKMGGGVGSETVRQTVSLCLRIGLFDKRLFDERGILTSRGIQRRYYEIIRDRPSSKRTFEHWLLTPDEMASDENAQDSARVCHTQNSSMSPINNDSSRTNKDLSPINEDFFSRKGREGKGSKEKGRKGEGAKAEACAQGEGAAAQGAWLQAMSDNGMKTTDKAKRIVGEVAKRYGADEACICVRIACSRGHPGPDYVLAVARSRAEEGQTGLPVMPGKPINAGRERPCKELPKHQYNQREYKAEELDALFCDIMKDGDENDT